MNAPSLSSHSTMPPLHQPWILVGGTGIPRPDEVQVYRTSPSEKPWEMHDHDVSNGMICLRQRPSVAVAQRRLAATRYMASAIGLLSIVMILVASAILRASAALADGSANRSAVGDSEVVFSDANIADWATYGRTHSEDHYSPLAQID